MATFQEMIPKIFIDGTQDMLRPELVIADSFADNMDAKIAQKGDKAIVTFSPVVEGQAYEGGLYAEPSKPKPTRIEIEINEGFQISFGIDEKDSVQAEPSVIDATGYVASAVKSYAEYIEAKAALQYRAAGIVVEPRNGNSFVIDKDNAWDMLEYMTVTADENNWSKKGRTAIITSRWAGFLGIQGKESNSTDGKNNEWVNGRAGKNLAGWDIKISNLLASNVVGGKVIYQPLFMLNKQACALLTQKNIKVSPEKLDRDPSQYFMGHAYFGIKTTFAKKLMTAPVQFGAMV